MQLSQINESVLEEKCRIDPFLDYFEDFLVNYIPIISSVEKISFPWDSHTNTDAMEGFFWPEQNSIWSGQYSSLVLMNDEIENNGIELDIYIPDELQSGIEHYLHIYINGKQTQEIDLNESGTRTIIISPDELYCKNEYFYLTFESDDSFLADDGRILSFSLLYAGPAKKEVNK